MSIQFLKHILLFYIYFLLIRNVCVGGHLWSTTFVVFIDGKSQVSNTRFHAPLTEDEQQKKKWMKADSPAYVALKSVVLDNKLQRDLRQMALFKHTGMPLKSF